MRSRRAPFPVLEFCLARLRFGSVVEDRAALRRDPFFLGRKLRRRVLQPFALHREALASPLSRGGGRINVRSADQTPATLSPASVSFGVSTGGKPADGAIDVAFHDETGEGLTCALSATQVQSGPKWVSLSAGTLSIPAGGTASATVILSGGRNIGSGFFYGDVVATCGSTTLRAPWFVGVQRGNGGLNGNMNGGLSDVDAIPAELLTEMTGTSPTI